MIKKRGLLALLLLFTILISTFVFASDNANESQFRSIEMADELDFLRGLNIVKDAELAGGTTKTVTRGEFATVVWRAMNQEAISAAADYPSIYNDVPTSHSAFAAITHMSGMGFFNGTGNNNFEPDADVTMYEAIKIAVIMCGYDKIMDKSAGYPNAYIAEASKRGLLKGLATTNGTARRVDVYILIYNAIHADIVDILSYGPDSKFAIQKNVNILSKYWELVKGQGIVTADNFTAIEGKKTIKAGALVIGGVEFLSQTEETVDKVGKSTKYYYKHDEEQGTNTIVYIEPYRNTIISLTADIIEDFDFAGGKYKIMENDRERFFSIGNKYLLSYNGEAIDGSDRSKMLPNCGTITLIDNDDDNIYNVVIINEYYNVIVDKFDKFSEIIYDKNGNHINLRDFTNIQADFDMTRIAENSVVSVFLSDDNIKLFYSPEKVTGVVNQIENDKELIVSIDGLEYRFSRDIKKSTSVIMAGNTYTFYIDYFGQVASFDMGSNMDYGYIVNFSTRGKDLNGRQVQILDITGELAEFSLTEKIKVTTPSGDMTYSDLDIDFIMNTERFVLYSKNQNREINKIVLPIVISTEADYYNLPDYPLYKMDYFLSEWPDPQTAFLGDYRTEIKGFRNWLICDERATVFQVPLMLGQTNITPDDVNVIGISNLPDRERLRVNKDIANIGRIDANDNEFLVYKVGNETLAPNVLVNYRKTIAKPVLADAHPSIITKISSVFDEQLGEVTYRLTLLKEGASLEVNLSSASHNTRAYLGSQNFDEPPTLAPNKRSLAVGDIIKYSTDKNNNISTLLLIYDAENDQMTYAGKTVFDGIFRLVGGEAYRISGNFVEMKLKSGVIERTNISGARVVICDLGSKNPVRTGSIADISPTDTLAIYSRYILNRVVFVYK